MSFLSSIGKIAKAVVKSPITKVVASGVAFVCPPAGIGALAAIQGASTIVDAADHGKAIVNSLKNGQIPPIPGGAVKFVEQYAPGVAGLAQSEAGKRAMAAAAVITNTAKEAAAGNPEAVRAMKLLKVVKAAKAGNQAAVAHLQKAVTSQVSRALKEGTAANATPAQKQSARLLVAVVKATSARKAASKKFAVNRHTARIVRVA